MSDKRSSLPDLSTLLRPVQSVPTYSRIMLTVLRSPILGYFAIAGNVALVTAVTLFHYFESGVNPAVKSWWDALWWGMATVTTVGYGDVTPITIGGRITAMFLMVSGLFMFIGFSAVMVSLFIAHAEREISRTKAVSMAEYEVLLEHIERLRQEVQNLSRK